MQRIGIYLAVISFVSVFTLFNLHSQGVPNEISPAAISKWEQQGKGNWQVIANKQEKSLKGIAPEYLLHWSPDERGGQGILRSEVFTIEKEFQVFSVAGTWGRNSSGNLDYNRIRLLSYPGGDLLRETVSNNYPFLSEERWSTHDLIGKKVQLEITSPSVYNFLGDSLEWIAFGNYRQVGKDVSAKSQNELIQAIRIDENASPVYCRSIPFLAVNPALRKNTTRSIEANREIIPVNATAEKLFLLGMINYGWENGVAHWSEHPEMLKKRNDQNYIGNRIGLIHIQYENGNSDTIPLIVGSTVWFSNHWSHGASHEVSIPCQEPFASRPELMKILRNSLKVYEDEYNSSFASDYKHFYLVVQPRDEKIKNIIVEDDINTRGTPLVSAVSFTGKAQKGNHSFGKVKIDPDDFSVSYDMNQPPDIKRDVKKLAEALYTQDSDLPDDPEILTLPSGLDATSIRFLGGREADWLSNMWTANLVQIHDKFDAGTGYFRETGDDCPWYGGYSGVGTWNIQGVYPAAYSRTSDHFVTLALRHINNPERESSFVDFCDYYLYFYRSNRDPEKGPPNDNLDISRYPKDAPPHWSMELNNPPTTGGLLQVNEIYGDEEMDGHASTLIGRWAAWRLQGGSANDWLIEEREAIFNKSRWESTMDAAEFICWLMDYTGMDLVYSEGEFTGWGGIGNNYCLVPEGMRNETDPVKIKENYANSNMYEPYPNFACMTALQCAAEMADSVGNIQLAEKWNLYANKIKEAMLRQLISGDFNELKWRISPYSILTTFQDRLVQSFFSLYGEGLDPQNWDQEMLTITRNTYHEHMQMPYGYQPVLAMGYGQGWLTHAALLLDEVDDAGPLLVNSAKYSYDKNMNFMDTERGIDWRKWMWIIPEGTNILPDGSWHRINDLSNGANQGPVMHAIEACAGVDDTNPASIKVLPRIPDPLEGISVSNHIVLIHEGEKLVKAKVDYEYKKGISFTLKSSKAIPDLSVRFGPYESPEEGALLIEKLKEQGYPAEATVSGSYKDKAATWVWIKNQKDIINLKIDL